MLEAVGELFADAGMSLPNNITGEELCVLVVGDAELEEETTPVQLPKAD